MHRSRRRLIKLTTVLALAASACIGDDMPPEQVGQGHDELAGQTLTTALDTSFASNGRYLSSGYEQSRASAVVIDAQDRTYTGGYLRSGYRNISALTRHRADGSVDTNWGYRGVVHKRLTNYNDEQIVDMASDSRGRLVVAVSVAGNRLVAARFHASGRIDTNFGANGVVYVAVPNANTVRASAVTIDDQDRVVVAGTAELYGQDRFVVSRLRTDGRPDTSFSQDGVTTVSFYGGSSASLSDVTSYQGRVFAVGSVNHSGRVKAAVARLTVTGYLDWTFNSASYRTYGRRLIQVPYATKTVATAAAMQGNKVVLVGHANGSGSKRFLAARLAWNGAMDRTFDYDGLVTGHRFAGWSGAGANAVVLDGEGRIVAGGYVESGSTRQFALMRYRYSGTLDSEFGYSGKLITNFTDSSPEYIMGLAIDSQERIVAAGGGAKSYKPRAAVARYSPRWSFGTMITGAYVIDFD